jgi:signal transduction histidine kinase
MSVIPPLRLRTVQRDLLVAAGVLVPVLVLAVATPAAGFEVDSPSARVALETLRLCVVGVTAGILALPFAQHGSVVRNAFVAALAVIAAASALLGVLPPVLAEVTGEAPIPADRFSPWLASRYLAGLLFVSAGAQWPRLGLRAYVWGALGVFAGATALLVVVTPPAPHLGDPWLLASLELPPLLLFGFGSWLASRLALRSGAPLERWLSLSLLVGVFTQLAAIRQPEALGPVVTTTDLLRVLSTVLLLIGAAAQARQLSRDRVRVVRLQRAELEEREAMVAALSGYVAREEMFRSIVHHELATPVATMRAYAHVLAGASSDDERWRAALSGLVAEAEQLDALIGRVDELRDLEEADFSCTLRPVRALPLLRELARFTTALPGRHQVRIDADDVRVTVDPVRLGQALRNIAANAVRYSPDGGRIDLLGEAVGTDRYRLIVADRGIGLDGHDPGGLLAFAGRGRNVDGTEGAGIGLYIARRIAEAHGGRITMEPNEPTGTRVAIEVARA